MYGVRKICFHTNRAIAGKKGFRKETDVFPLDIDKEIKRARIKKMKPVVITRTEKNG